MTADHAYARLPPLAALRAFEATARLGSATAAAAELAVTQGAVSRQVMALERALGVALFQRRNRRMVLTPAGTELAAAAGAAFARLAEGVAQVRAQGAAVTLHASTTFAPRWLLPRLARFLADHPRFDLRLEIRSDTEAALADPTAAVLGYVQGASLPPGALALLPDRSGPVAAPAYLAAAPPATLRRLAQQRLLVATADGWDWRQWAAAAAASLPDLRAAIRLENDEAAIQAALAGAGLALVTLELVAGELAAGRLLQPRGLPPTVLGTYYLRSPSQQPAARRFKPLAEWLLAEAAALPTPPPPARNLRLARRRAPG